MDSIENDIDFIITKTHRLQAIIDNEDYHLLESKELVRQRLIQQFFDDYKPIFFYIQFFFEREK